MRIAVALVLVAACTSSGGGGSGTSGQITWDFNGTMYSGTLLHMATLLANADGGNALDIEASDSQDHLLDIGVSPATLASTIALGTYNTAADMPNAVFQYGDGSNGTGTWGAGGDPSLTGSGSVTITWMIATEIKGTFETTLTGSGNDPGTGTATITNGVFDLTFD
jgi:hypothetical protein